VELAVAHKRPPCDSTMERLMAKPMPEPCGLVVKKALNIRSATNHHSSKEPVPWGNRCARIDASRPRWHALAPEFRRMSGVVFFQQAESYRIKFATTILLQSVKKYAIFRRGVGEQSHTRTELQVVG